MDDRGSKVDQITTKIHRALEVCVINLGKDHEMTKECMANYKNLMKRLARIEMEKETRTKAIDKARKHPSALGYKEEYNRESEIPNIDVAQTKRCKDFEKFLNDVNQAGGSGGATTSAEGMTVTESIQRIDPFTKKSMVNPVRNNICKHVYDKDSLINIINMNDQVKCPYVGCTNKKRLRMADVTEDTILRIQFANADEDSD